MALQAELRPLGRIVRLQIQRAALKVGEKPCRVYDPAPILALGELTLTPQGAVARLPDGATLLDIHNAAHPHTRNVEGVNSLSVGFTAHYAAMRAQHGPHVVDGCAGENLLIETDQRVDFSMLARGLAIQAAGTDALVWLRMHKVAAPCREFSGFVMGGAGAPALKEALQFLDGGLRGFYGALAQADPVIVALGDRVLVSAPGTS
jgi:hypothetical protein